MIYWIKKYFSNLETHIQSLYEVLMVALFSLAPFFITYFVRMAKAADNESIPFDDMIGRGQLYLLAYSIFGTVFWLAFAKSDRPRHSARAFLGFIGTVLIIPVIGFLGVDPTFSTILNSFAVSLSYFMYAGFLILNYLLLFYIQIDPPQPTEILDREAGEMRRRYSEMQDNG